MLNIYSCFKVVINMKMIGKILWKKVCCSLWRNIVNIYLFMGYQNTCHVVYPIGYNGNHIWGRIFWQFANSSYKSATQFLRFSSSLKILVNLAWQPGTQRGKLLLVKKSWNVLSISWKSVISYSFEVNQVGLPGEIFLVTIFSKTVF